MSRVACNLCGKITKDRSPACPVCNRPLETPGRLRTHLLVAHHKSDVADAILESATARSENQEFNGNTEAVIGVE